MQRGIDRAREVLRGWLRRGEVTSSGEERDLEGFRGYEKMLWGVKRGEEKGDKLVWAE